jgi:hypothetical protein
MAADALKLKAQLFKRKGHMRPERELSIKGAADAAALPPIADAVAVRFAATRMSPSGES